jgi:hypothetical protein
MIQHTLRMIIATSAVLVGGLGGVALADGNPAHGAGRRAELMKQFDTNRDGTLDDAEREQLRIAFDAKRAEGRAQRLARFDTDRDGTLSPAERATMLEQHAAERSGADERKRDRGTARGAHRGGVPKRP